METGRQLLLDPVRSLSAGFFLRYLQDFCPFVSAESCGEEVEALRESEAYDFVLRNHPWTNFHPVVEATCNLTKMENRGPFSLMSIYAAKPNALSDAEYALRKLMLYQKIKWPFDIDQKAREWAQSKKQGGVPLVGAHIRYTDNWEDSKKVAQGLNTGLKQFQHAVLDVHERYASMGCKVNFLLCSDSPRVKYMFGKLGLNLLAAPVLTKDRYLQAMFEMLLLSHCDLLIGSTSSTFSYEAAFLSGGTDIMTCTKGVWETTHLRSVRRSAARDHKRSEEQRQKSERW
eukprot:CAMPEP_0184304346 /NCGR_PEP_ID=MMETSP1049-20130417/13891_1 /TAXON_ID=77928 /ORGANISM="Proteomonas sulcata, Strain CCMP704" /LENGTH=286 /DNA_ID=CAMNT_0026616139 /DNA_START=191 /DNA_END=1048 /DNA_ORIENTATION=+